MLEDFTYEQKIDTTNITWYVDTNNYRQLGYNGTFQVIWYHPEPPYYHKAIVEFPNRIYIIYNSSAMYKIIFNEYNSGFLSYKFKKI